MNSFGILWNHMLLGCLNLRRCSDFRAVELIQCSWTSNGKCLEQISWIAIQIIILLCIPFSSNFSSSYSCAKSGMKKLSRYESNSIVESVGERSGCACGETSCGSSSVVAAGGAVAVALAERSLALFSDDSMPDWIRRPFITHGYRPVGLPMRRIVASAFRIHNETGNFWTHAIPSVLFGCIALPYTISFRLAHESLFDRAIMCVYVLAVTTCHSASSMYHLFACRSQKTFTTLCRLDYKAIVSLICASQMPAISVLIARKSTILGFIALSILGILWLIGMPLMNVLERYEMDSVKNFLMIFMAFYSLIFVAITRTFRALHFPRDEIVFVLKRVGIMYACYSVGFIIWGLKFPERCIPGRVNLVGHSHQLWHMAVTAASSTWLFALYQIYDFSSSSVISAGLSSAAASTVSLVAVQPL